MGRWLSKGKLIFFRVSLAGEEGCPGTLGIRITYELLDGNTLRITCEADTDKGTPLSLTNHSYFNLHGHGDILDHTLQLEADAYTEINRELIPTGRLLPVEDSPMDFLLEKRIGRDLHAECEQLRLAGGYDHNFVLNGRKPMARLYGPETGIVMTMETTEPGVQVYSGNSITPRKGRGGLPIDIHGSICLETQQFPDAVHHPNFPSPILKPGVRYQSNVSAFRNCCRVWPPARWLAWQSQGRCTGWWRWMKTTV